MISVGLSAVLFENQGDPRILKQHESFYLVWLTIGLVLFLSSLPLLNQL
jgi:hypothetical protein